MPRQTLNEQLRKLPSVDEALAHPLMAAALDAYPRDIIVDTVRSEIDATRKAILAASGGESAPAACGAHGTAAATSEEPLLDRVIGGVVRRLQSFTDPSLRRVVNASGVIVHTNLGRSALAESAVEAVTQVARGYSTLEYNVAEMRRGSRHDHCEQLICTLTGAEAAIAVNNNAAAVMMVLSEFASGHEAVVSRGELVEIGGSFRIPDIMEQSHARMVEVGATNKTHDFDYERAITDDTAMLLKVHTSNYRLIGFTESVAGRDLRRIADAAIASRKARGVCAPELLVYEDLGSGALLTIDNLGDFNEPTAGEALASGCDLVSFSGDKLLGGPQAGIIIGAKPLIDRLKKHPLARALRLDKMTLAALEATLRLYLDPERAQTEIPTLRMLAASADDVRPCAEALAARIESELSPRDASVTVVPEISRAGGGALPMRDIETFAVQLTFKRGEAQACEEHLVRKNDVPIIARISKETLLFDARTLLADSEHDEIAQALARYFATLNA